IQMALSTPMKFLSTLCAKLFQTQMFYKTLCKYPCPIGIIKKLALIFLILTTISCQSRKNDTSLFLKKAHEVLVKSQEENGSWDPKKFEGNYKSDEGIIALTALSLASLLQASQSYDVQIKKAISYLLERQTEEGNISLQNYANAISLYALC